MSVLEALCTAATMLFLFRLVVTDLGVAAVGAWSLVAATLSFSSIADIGLGGALMRFVPTALSRGREDDAVSYVQTSLISIGLLYLAILALAGPLFGFVLSLSVPDADKPLVMQILPYSLVAFWLGNVATVFLFGLASVQRYDLRSAIVIGGMVVQFATAILLIPHLGLVGLVWAQIVQNVMLIGCGFFVLKRKLPGLPWLPFRFSTPHFREMLRYGVNLQMFSVASFLFEPTAKLILSNFGGLSWVGYYELATRAARQVRTLVVNASRVLVPAVAQVHERNQASALSIYQRASDLTWLLAWPVMGTLAALTPALSQFWLGREDRLFIVTALLLIAGWTVNLVCAPSYFMALGIDRMKWNLIGWGIISSTNVVLGVICGKLFGGLGVIAATAGALGLGSAALLFGNHLAFGGKTAQILNRPSIATVLFSFAGTVFALRLYPTVESAFGSPLAALVSLAVMGVAGLASLALYPDARALLRRVRTANLWRAG